MTDATSSTSVTSTTARPRIRDSVLVFRLADRIQFVCLMDLRVKEFTVPAFVVDLVPLLDGGRTADEILAELQGVARAEGSGVPPWPELSSEELHDVLEVLRGERLLDRAVPASPEDLQNRYGRQERLFEEFIASFDHLPASPRELQERLLASRVAVVGAGGVGSWVLQSLVAAGVGCVEIIDPDVVERTNLNRQVLYTDSDVGRAKVEVAADRFRAMNPGVRVITRNALVGPGTDLRPVAAAADLVINCADEPSVVAVSDIVAEAAHAEGTPHLVGGAYGGNLGVPGTSVVPGETVCWACVRAATADDHGRGSTVALKGRGRSVGSLAPITGIVANLMAWEALRILLGLPLALSGQVRELNIMSLDWRVRQIAPRAGCARCTNLGVRA